MLALHYSPPKEAHTFNVPAQSGLELLSKEWDELALRKLDSIAQLQLIHFFCYSLKTEQKNVTD